MSHPIPCEERRGHGGGRFACAFLGILRGLELVPSKGRSLVPPTSTPKEHNASRWAAFGNKMRHVQYQLVYEEPILGEIP